MFKFSISPESFLLSRDNVLKSISVLIMSSLLASCSNSPRLLNFPFDRGGRSLNSPASELTPQIDSQYIVFVSDRNGSQGIYLFDAKNRRLIDLPGLNALNAIASHPSISSDGRYIVFAASIEGKSAIYLYDRQTEQRRNLTENIVGEVRNPSVSGDGSKIAFQAATDGQWDIKVYNRFGEPDN